MLKIIKTRKSAFWEGHNDVTFGCSNTPKFSKNVC